MVEAIRCELCGAVAKYPVTKTIDGRELSFCCSGCLQVYELMRDEGQSGGETPAQIQVKPIITADQRHAGTMPLKTITLTIGGMSCANCVATVEKGLRKVPGVVSVNVSLSAERAIVEITPGAVTIDNLKNAVKATGYEAFDAAGSEDA